eukprot:3322901-Alexandrium_andersonii.AAC.1
MDCAVLVAEEVEELVWWPWCTRAADVKRVVAQIAGNVGNAGVERSTEVVGVTHEAHDFVVGPVVERRHDCGAGH